MAYQPENLSCLSYANGFTLWHYRTPDPAEAVMATGYFDPAVRMVRRGDWIMVNLATASGTPGHETLAVTSNDGQFVEVVRVSAQASA